MASKKMRRKSPLPAIVLLVIALAALIYSEYSNVTGGIVGVAPGSAGFGIGHAVAIVCVLAAAAWSYFPTKK